MVWYGWAWLGGTAAFISIPLLSFGIGLNVLRVVRHEVNFAQTGQKKGLFVLIDRWSWMGWDGCK